MASIAYISDEKMIEFHRLHGHDEINFWRLSTRQFSDFKTNDFLFFLVKTHKKEKGIAGFGKLARIENLSLNQMWNRYDTKNGYASKEELKKVIESANKQESFPRKLNCLYLEQVVFFEAPLFLSEFGFDLHYNLESFTYIDQDDDVTSKILASASTIGIDLWTMSTTKHQSFDFEHEILVHQLSNLVATEATPAEKKLAKSFNKNRQLKCIPNHEAIFVDKNGIYVPLASNKRKDTLSVFGWLAYCLKKVPALSKMKLSLYTDRKLSEEDQELFTLLAVDLIHPDEP